MSKQFQLTKYLKKQSLWRLIDSGAAVCVMDVKILHKLGLKDNINTKVET